MQRRPFAWLLLFLALPAWAVVENTTEDPWDFALAPLASKQCTSHLREMHGAPGEAELALAREFSVYEQLVEQALVYRARTVEVGARLRDLSGPLSGADLQLLSEGMVSHLQLRNQLLRMAESHECWLDDSAELDELLNPRQRLEGIMLSLSAALVLYDNYLLAITLYEEDEHLRRVLNQPDSGYDIGRDILASVSDSYNSINHRARVRRAITFYEQHIGQLKPEARRQARVRYLEGLIEQSASYDMTKAYSPAYIIGRKLDFMGRITRDQLAFAAAEGVSVFSMLFGNTVGLVETRKGKLYHRDEVTAAVSGQLRAGDILLEKTPFRLTDALIPGHWGHVAVWIGSEAELRELGLWDHPLVQPHHKSIRKGAGVVEALRSGVTLNRLEHFLNVDDLAVLRARDSDASQRATLVLNALRQIGKDYDFNFDVETSDRIVCSELVYVTYTQIPWPTTMTLGRATISPDQVAVRALPGGPLQLVLLYHDGKAVTQQAEQRLAKLLGEKETLAASQPE